MNSSSCLPLQTGCIPCEHQPNILWISKSKTLRQLQALFQVLYSGQSLPVSAVMQAAGQHVGSVVITAPGCECPMTVFMNAAQTYSNHDSLASRSQTNELLAVSIWDEYMHVQRGINDSSDRTEPSHCLTVVSGTFTHQG